MRGQGMDLSKSLRLSIAKKGVKHRDMAEEMSINPQLISNWIRRGAIRHSALIDICKYFDISVSEFIALGED